MTQRRGPAPTDSTWGQGHLPADAIVAYVDEELSPGAQRRALEHLSRCRECAVEVVAQTQARLALRGSGAPTLSSSLLHNLRNIPTDTELAAPPAGLAIGPDGEIVSMLREPRRHGRRRPLDRRVRLGAGAVVSGIALGALMVAGHPVPAASPNASVSPGGTPRSTLDARMHVSGVVLDTARAVPARVAPAPRPTILPVRRHY